MLKQCFILMMKNKQNQCDTADRNVCVVLASVALEELLNSKMLVQILQSSFIFRKLPRLCIKYSPNWSKRWNSIQNLILQCGAAVSAAETHCMFGAPGYLWQASTRYSEILPMYGKLCSWNTLHTQFDTIVSTNSTLVYD